MQKSWTIEEVEVGRRRTTVWAIKASIALVLYLWTSWEVWKSFSAGPTFRVWVQVAGAFLLFWLFIGYAIFTWLEFRRTWRAFYYRRCYHAVEALRWGGYNFSRFGKKKLYGKWAFWRAKDLKAYEVSYLEYLHSYRRAEDLFQQECRWARANLRLEAQFLEILSEFQVSDDQLKDIMSGFSSYANPRRRREYIRHICSRLTYEQWKSRNETLVRNDPSELPLVVLTEEDIELRSLEIQASKVASERARGYYEEGLKAIARRDRLRLFGFAVGTDVREAELEAEAEKPQGQPQSKSESAEVRHISLNIFVRERLAVMQSLVNGANWQVCREIVLALAEPGRSGARFNEHYWDESLVESKVRRQCLNYANIHFEPAAFEESVRWLIKQRVLVTKPKPGKRVLSLSSHVNDALTPAAGQIIASVLRVKRELSGLPS